MTIYLLPEWQEARGGEDASSPVCWRAPTSTVRQKWVLWSLRHGIPRRSRRLPRGQVQYGLTDDERSDWLIFHTRSTFERASVGTRPGLDAAWALISTSLSAAGLTRAEAIMQMEEFLWDDGDMDAVGKYFFTMFDEPSSETPWGWQPTDTMALNYRLGHGGHLAPSLRTTPKMWSTGIRTGLTPMSPERISRLRVRQPRRASKRHRLGETLDPD